MFSIFTYIMSRVTHSEPGLPMVKDKKMRKMTAGKEDGDFLSAGISDVHWTARLTFTEDRVAGHVDIVSDFGQPKVTAKHRLASSLADLAEQTLAGISGITARLTVGGTIRRPEIQLTSDLGPQIAAGFDTAFSAFVPQMKQQLTAELTGFLDGQRTAFLQKYGTRYQQLLDEHKEVIAGLTEAHQIAADLRSGQVDADRVFRLASESGLLKEKDAEKADRYRDKAGEVLRGLQSPEKTLQDALPNLRRKLFK